MLIDLLDSELPQTFNLFKKKKALYSKFNKMRSACEFLLVSRLPKALQGGSDDSL